MVSVDYIQKAASLLQGAVEELRESRETGDMIKARDAAGKAWVALVEASRAFLMASGVPEQELPATHRGTRYLLRRHGDAETRALYNECYQDVHQDAYYDGLINYDTLEDRFAEIRGLIDRVDDASARG